MLQLTLHYSLIAVHWFQLVYSGRRFWMLETEPVTRHCISYVGRLCHHHWLNDL